MSAKKITLSAKGLTDNYFSRDQLVSPAHSHVYEIGLNCLLAVNKMAQSYLCTRLEYTSVWLTADWFQIAVLIWYTGLNHQ